MPLVVNGTTIPTNVANALMVNGVSITKVVANGVAVWNQSLFNGVWSGTVDITKNHISISGSSYRIGVIGSYNSGVFYGGWITVVSPSNIGSGTSSVTPGTQYAVSNTKGFSVSGLLIASIWGTTYGPWGVSFSPSTLTFSGHSSASSSQTPGTFGFVGIESSGNMLRQREYVFSDSVSNWVSLT